ncbi:hypothetical protein H4219_004769, partial [Mycoemilia scoparia]
VAGLLFVASGIAIVYIVVKKRRQEARLSSSTDDGEESVVESVAQHESLPRSNTALQVPSTEMLCSPRSIGHNFAGRLKKGHCHTITTATTDINNEFFSQTHFDGSNIQSSEDGSDALPSPCSSIKQSNSESKFNDYSKTCSTYNVSQIENPKEQQHTMDTDKIPSVSQKSYSSSDEGIPEASSPCKRDAGADATQTPETPVPANTSSRRNQDDPDGESIYVLQEDEGLNSLLNQIEGDECRSQQEIKPTEIHDSEESSNPDKLSQEKIVVGANDKEDVDYPEDNSNDHIETKGRTQKQDKIIELGYDHQTISEATVIEAKYLGDSSSENEVNLVSAVPASTTQKGDMAKVHKTQKKQHLDGQLTPKKLQDSTNRQQQSKHISKRCTKWPYCTNTNCKFHHPKQICAFYPTCKFFGSSETASGGTNILSPTHSNNGSGGKSMGRRNVWCTKLHPHDLQRLRRAIGEADNDKGFKLRRLRKNIQPEKVNEMKRFFDSIILDAMKLDGWKQCVDKDMVFDKNLLENLNQTDVTTTDNKVDCNGGGGGGGSGQFYGDMEQHCPQPYKQMHPQPQQQSIELPMSPVASGAAAAAGMDISYHSPISPMQYPQQQRIEPTISPVTTEMVSTQQEKNIELPPLLLPTSSPDFSATTNKEISQLKEEHDPFKKYCKPKDLK